MSTQLIRRPSQAEKELAARRAELNALQAELAERELVLTTLLAELAVFQGRYLREVGALYAEFDEWNAKIAEFLAQRDGTQQGRSDASEARVQAEKSARAVHAATVRPKEFRPSVQLKRLYREVARKVHPDLAMDDEDRTRRERLMAEANAAYQRGDAEALEQILVRYESSRERTDEADIAVELERVTRWIAKIRSRLSQIDEQITGFESSHLAVLKDRADAVTLEGRDLLSELAADLKRRIAAARLRFENLSISHETCKQ